MNPIPILYRNSDIQSTFNSLQFSIFANTKNLKLLKLKDLDKSLETIQEMGDNHIGGATETPLRPDAFDLSDIEKIELIKKDVESIMETLGLDLTDDSLKGTPNRVAKMFVQEIFSGLHPDRKPKASTFDNKYKYNEMLVEKNITVYSTCRSEEHTSELQSRPHLVCRL